ncbi:metabotropic glutamate receptor 1 [Dendroctonus ponderosae]|uniref:metabotropic glutamate receptor 1 n=1 Tax=Dendroctonus ponderosae TaxID=77166 RepID=UPI002036439A|nr:metabotropic glutamate receptor 1 [Dendroctonus ponderosae]
MAQWGIFALLVQRCCSRNHSESSKRASAFLMGDFVVGGLFPLHHQPVSMRNSLASLDIKCGEIRELYGIQRVEAMFQTLDEINGNPDLLPDVALGAEIRDECWYAPVALQQSIELIRDSIRPVSRPETCLGSEQEEVEEGKAKGPLVGIIGPGSSSVALQVQNLLQLFHIPQIGYSTTSRDLSDKNRFNYFLRVVPSDYYQAQVILDIVRFFGWSYVSAVNTDENYGQSGIQAFRELADEADVCIAREDSVLSNAADEVFDKVILNLRQDLNAVVVVCFCEGLTVRGLLRAIERLNLTNYFLFIGSDGWADRSDVTRHYEAQAWGGLSIRIHSPYVNSFDEYYWSLQPDKNTRNPWFPEFWEAKFQCAIKERYSGPPEAHKPYCTGQESLQTNYKQDPKLSFVIKAIYSLAHALHSMIQAVCGVSSGFCPQMLPFNGSLLKSHLMNVSFDFNGETFQFDENGDPPGRYDIMNYQKMPDGSFEYVQVGSWNNRSLLWMQPPKFPEIRSRKLVRSVCAEECPNGFYKNIQQGGKDKRCWVCVPCPLEEILSVAGDKCEKCPQGFAATSNRTACQLLQVEFVQWTDRSAVVAMVFSILGLLTTAFAFIVLIQHNNTPVVKSSSKELCYLILAGMTVAHASIFAMLSKPSPSSCASTRLLPGVAFAMIYSALLTKTNRIARILAGSKRNFPNRKLLFMSATAQVMIALSLISLEALANGAMLYLQPPAIAFVYLPNKTLMECDISFEAIVVPLAFDFVLILLCTVYAIKSRNVPENFSEAKFIGFAMYTTCVIWIAFVPIYFGSGAKTITMCMCVTLSALVTWVFLFVPKLYIILLQPEKNNRAFFTTAKIRCHIGRKVAASNSWKESSISVTTIDPERPSREVPRRTMSCQTGLDLLETLLHPKRLVGELGAKIVEKRCCPDPDCPMKHITITLPDNRF